MQLRRRHTASTATLQARADASAAKAKTDAAAAKWSLEADLCMRIVSKRADALQVRVDDAASYDQQRADIAVRLQVAENTAADLANRITNARDTIDAALVAGDVNTASAHGTAVGSMQLTLQRAQMIVGELSKSFDRVPTSDLSDAEVADLSVLRSTALSPSASYKMIVPSLTVDTPSELRAVGAYAREHPAPMMNTNRPMIVNR
jgi:hypothetical protein